MSTLSHVFEAAGIATATIVSNRQQAEGITPPRALYCEFPLGRPLGRPRDPAYQRRGIGTELVRKAADVARERGIRWLHVDYLPELEPFYRQCGFRPTAAGLMDLLPYDEGNTPSS